MAIAHRKVGTRDPHWQIERTSSDQLLVVDVTAVDARLLRGDRAKRRRRGYAHHAKKRREPQFGSPRQRAHAPRPIDRNVADDRLVEILRERARKRADHVVTPVGARLDLLYAHLQHITGFSAG